MVYVNNAQVERFTFDFEGIMTCIGCEASVKNAFQNVDGVLKTDVSYATRSATIAFDKTKTIMCALDTSPLKCSWREILE